MKIVKLSASWCGPCKILSATMKKIFAKEEYKDIEFIITGLKITKDNRTIAGPVNLTIRTVTGTQ